jgi:hypothetical protein
VAADLGWRPAVAGVAAESSEPRARLNHGAKGSSTTRVLGLGHNGQMTTGLWLHKIRPCNIQNQNGRHHHNQRHLAQWFGRLYLFEGVHVRILHVTTFFEQFSWIDRWVLSFIFTLNNQTDMWVPLFLFLKYYTCPHRSDMDVHVNATLDALSVTKLRCLS